MFVDPAAAQPSDATRAQAKKSDAGQDSNRTPDDSRVRTPAGPEGVTRKLEEVYERKTTFPTPPWARPYFDWKLNLKEEHRLSYGLSAYLLYQKASKALGNEDDAFGGIYRFQGSWIALGRDTGHPGRLEWRLESRSPIGGGLSPRQLGDAVGAAALNTGFGYNPVFHTDFSVLNWTQVFNDQRAGISVGRLAFDVYLDAYLFQTFTRGFLNRAFLINPTLATTGVGALGASTKAFVSDNVWLGAHIFDGNAVNGEFDLDTFKENEWLKGVEMGWSPSISRIKTDRIQLTYWEKDARQKAGVPRGSGWVASASYLLNDRWIPFARAGHSDGGAGVAAESAVSIGFEYARSKSQTWSVGAGWAKPSEKTFESGLRDEYVFETSYTFQLSPVLSLTPDVQLMLHPAKNPAASSVWIFGLRAILAL